MTVHNETFEKTARWLSIPSFDPPLAITRDSVNRQRPALLNKAHCHKDFFALYIVREGVGTHIIDDVPYSISRGDVYVMRPGARHLYTQCRDLTLDGLYFRPDIFDEATRSDLAAVPGFGGLFIEEPVRRHEVAATRRADKATFGPENGRWLRLTVPQYEAVRTEIDELQREWEESAASFGRASLVRGLLLRLIIHLSRYYSAAPPVTSATVHSTPLPADSALRIREATVIAAIAHMREHLAEPLRIEQISASVFLSSDHFSKIFTAVVGRSPSDYLRDLRIAEAKRLLTTTDDAITEVANAVGFHQAAYFSHVFKTATGTTPREYRRASQNK